MLNDDFLGVMVCQGHVLKKESQGLISYTC